jgi:hypothetical protein
MDKLLFGLFWCFLHLDDIIMFSRIAAEQIHTVLIAPGKAAAASLSERSLSLGS